MCIFTIKVSTQKLTGYSSSSQWYAKLGSGITRFIVPHHFPKVTKKDWINTQKNTNFTDFRRLSAKNCEFLSSKCMGQNDQLSFPIVMVCETWRWYYRFGRGMSSSKSDKKDWMSAQTHQFCEKLFISTLKVSMQNLTSYPSSLQWYVKLGQGITSLAVVQHLPKVTK